MKDELEENGLERRTNISLKCLHLKMKDTWVGIKSYL